MIETLILNYSMSVCSVVMNSSLPELDLARVGTTTTTVATYILNQPYDSYQQLQKYINFPLFFSLPAFFLFFRLNVLTFLCVLP